MHYSLSADKSVKYRLDGARKETQYSWTFSWNSPRRNNQSSHGSSGLFSAMSPLLFSAFVCVCVCVCSCFYFFSFLLAFIQLCSIFQPLSLSLFPANFRLSYPCNSKKKSLKKKKKKTSQAFISEGLLSFPGVIVFFYLLFWWPRWFRGHIFPRNYFSAFKKRRSIYRSIRAYTHTHTHTHTHTSPGTVKCTAVSAPFKKKKKGQRLTDRKSNKAFVATCYCCTPGDCLLQLLLMQEIIKFVSGKQWA